MHVGMMMYFHDSNFSFDLYCVMGMIIPAIYLLKNEMNTIWNKLVFRTRSKVVSLVKIALSF